MSVVEHSGEVVSIDAHNMTISFEVGSSCLSCSARRHCFSNGGEQSQRIIVVPLSGEGYAVGDMVKVQIRSSLARKAVLFCYIFPLLVLLLSLCASAWAGEEDGLCALIALFSLALYFTLLWMFRNRISRNINFQIYK